MKKVIVSSFALLLLVNVSKAQDVTDEQLWKYALMTEVIDQMKADISRAVNDLIQAQEGMDGARYKELAGGAEPANDFEAKFMETIDKVKNDRIEAIKSVNSDLATKMLGGADVYKSAKAAASGDMKDKYEEFKNQISYSGM